MLYVRDHYPAGSLGYAVHATVQTLWGHCVCCNTPHANWGAQWMVSYPAGSVGGAGGGRRRKALEPTVVVAPNTSQRNLSVTTLLHLLGLYRCTVVPLQ